METSSKQVALPTELGGCIDGDSYRRGENPATRERAGNYAIRGCARV